MDTNYKHKWMQLPRSVVFGHGIIDDLAKVCIELKLDGTAVIVSGKNTRELFGSKAKSVLEDSSYDVHTAAVENTSDEQIKKVENFCREVKTNFILGIGGGKSIDVAKVVSKTLSIPFISVPTAASHDGIVSSIASVSRNGQMVSVEAKSPLAVVADTEVIAGAPHRLLASGCADIISNYTAVRDWELAHRLCGEAFSEYASTLSSMTAQIIMNSSDSIKPGLEESAWMVIKALVSSGVAMSIAGSSRPASGSEHKFAHALSRIASNSGLHGEQCGLGTIMMMYLHGGDWQSIKDALSKIGAPTTASELGIREEHIIQALLYAHNIRPERYTILSRGLNEKAAVNLAEATGVIG
ncbi:MAG: Glycerol-1-phosphate dehydrogenase [NAD(P)+] [Candidatus Argoarchaeum ethanivorans]|uniref:Glycerol-1-phosphate dehydrogenase [NAD(P)+] n=1 Tax=Candidatus Argoarchaeum ethanivorans TaxID=2608793 RepID=A0A812A2B9_9EURY|nr:MAG: Glycerol-1-phosphate dehydrogenase [NAD(P)+] [Candidatus Argoarchaeum ethanivorans]